MPAERISDPCSPTAHPERTVRPDDCPTDAASIESARSGFEIPTDAPSPRIVVDGGDGDDQVIIGDQDDKLILVSGGKGNDSLIVQGAGHGEVGEHLVAAEAPAWTLTGMPIEAELLLVAFLITLATVGALGWRALAGASGGPRGE